MSFKGSLSRIILDEIALEGLEGCTLETLWVLLSTVLELPMPLSTQLQQQVWQFIQRTEDHLSFYEIPCSRATLKPFNRYQHVDPSLGVPITPDECPFPRYKCVPVSGENNGSCEFYKERIEIGIDQLRELNLDDAMKKWGNKLVIVASQELRKAALTPVNVDYPVEITPIQYCIWEAIGRSRYNGETTAGRWSLLDYCKDSAMVFYIKNKLIRFGVVAHQPFNEKRDERLVVSTLMTLHRFYDSRRSRLFSVIETLFHMLKKAPNNQMTMVEARTHFPNSDAPHSFKRIAMTHLFRRIFEVKSVPYVEYYGNKGRASSSQKGARMVVVVRLVNCNSSIEDILADESQEKDDTCDFYNESHSFVDMPVVDELYRAVARHGTRGCSHTELCSYLSMHHLSVRQVEKKVKEDGLLKSYCVDAGRQRINHYVALDYADSVKKAKDVSTAVLKNLQCAENPNIPKDIDLPTLNDVPTIIARVKPFEYNNPNSNSNRLQRETSTLRHVARKSLVIRSIDEKCIVPVVQVRQIIQSAEKNQGYTDEICQKSLNRLLYYLTESNLVCVYEIELRYDGLIKSTRYVTHPKIHPDHIVLKHEILKLKNNLLLTTEERLSRAKAQLTKKLKVADKTAKKSSKTSNTEKSCKDIVPLHTHKPPKFLISRYMHEFLFYIVVELNESTQKIPITEELLQGWQQTEPALQIREYMEQLQQEGPTSVAAYTKDISWRTFIPPLPQYPDKPAGWVYFIDAVERIPLSVFNKIFRIEKSQDERLKSYLSHPLRQHYLIRQLPSDLQRKINRYQLQKIYITILKLLTHMGLVQVSKRQNAKDPLVRWVFLNRHAQILDTTTTEPCYSKINPERKYDATNYYFLSFNDLHMYWINLQRICIYTKLGFRRGKDEKSTTAKEMGFVREIDFDDAPHYDTIDTPGDRSGAAGLSSQLFAHTFRNWSWVLHTNSKPAHVRTGRTAATARSKISAKTPELSSPHTRKHYTLMPKAVKRIQVGAGAATKRVTNSKKTGARDAIDRDALKNMRTLRVTWRKEEDELLKIARAVYLYVAAPIAALELLTIGKICRDILRHNLGSYNKTMQACVRRAQFIVKMNRHVPEVPTWVHTLQTNEYMKCKYGDDFLKRLKEVYSQRNEYCDALVMHFIHIMGYLYKIIHNTSAIAMQNKFMIPDTMAEFLKKFRERATADSEQIIHYSNPKTEFELQVVMVNCVLHSSLCCGRDKTSYNLQAFEIYKHFSEEVLHEGFKKARGDGLVVAIRRKQMQHLPSQLAGPAYLLSSKYRLRLMFLKIPYIVYDAFYGYFEQALVTIFGPSTSDQSARPHFQLKSPHLGQLFFIAEGITKNVLSSHIKMPVNILTVDVEQRQTVSAMDRILGHYQSFFDNAPQREYTKSFESDANEKQVHVKFHPANLSYKIHYNPYDFISKLSTRHLHFFCALDHLHQEVDINFSKLHRKDEEYGFVIMECPFNCIMKNGNYINAIERIVHEKKSVLDELCEVAPQKLLNMATSDSTVTVQPSNLLTLVRMLESYWMEKEEPSEIRDLGKVPSTLRTSKSMDWYQLCHDILEYKFDEDYNDKNDEYEPTLNKEERLARAQDVFVVNLPTLQFSESPQLSAELLTESIEHNGLTVPKSMFETELQREVVLQKIVNEAHWEYTENTLETLAQRLDELNFNTMERRHLEEIYDFIESHKLGVTVTDLLYKFPYKEFLLRALHLLSEFFLIKRVGIATVMYVHKLHVRPWVVHTFHVKRLDRESLGTSTKTTLIKRKHSNDGDGNDDDDDGMEDHSDAESGPSTSKRLKLNEPLEEEQSSTELLGKRVSKPVKRFRADEDTEPTTHDIKKRDVIVMKPQPWIRLNGSLNRRVVDRWLGSILTECISRSGCTVHAICIRFPHMTPVDIIFLLEILADLKCIHLTQMEPVETDIFSSYVDVKESIVTELYDPEQTYITAHADAVMRMAIFIGNKKYTSEFV